MILQKNTFFSHRKNNTCVAQVNKQVFGFPISLTRWLSLVRVKVMVRTMYLRVVIITFSRVDFFYKKYN